MQKLQKRYRYSLNLLRELVIADFKVKYQDSVLGYVWSIIRPLFMFTILYIVFAVGLRVGKGIENWPIALLAGVVLWQFFSDVAYGSLRSIVNKGSLMRKINFPRFIIIISISVSAFITLLINSIVVFVFAAFGGVELSWGMLLVVPLILELFIFALGVAFIISTAYVKFRDVQHIWDIISQALFYGSAIIFPISLITANINQQWIVNIILANPVAQVIQDVRHMAISNDVPNLWTVGNENPWLYLPPLAIALITFIIGVRYFRRNAPYFAENA